MQRLFSMFPAGAAGIGLFLLRLAVAWSFFLDPSAARPVHPWLAIPGLGICLGFLTPISVLACCLLQFHAIHGMGGQPGGAALGVRLLSACALALLGPGAYSLDARLFGRRVVDFTPHKPPPTSDERRED
ncbi:hypothetical protein LY474_01870 [Myxococcus stipitatus]|uniref:hypothetical protein n=1 Tax=Myxococcus stipitatus TaxID=83455 RepID=UPI001F20C384|nr:hypothetical protein [Myxococcus stipitatus]MCE9666548.1 hypothetical protein [Myxococcus stipitatus]